MKTKDYIVLPYDSLIAERLQTKGYTRLKPMLQLPNKTPLYFAIDYKEKTYRIAEARYIGMLGIDIRKITNKNTKQNEQQIRTH